MFSIVKSHDEVEVDVEVAEGRRKKKLKKKTLRNTKKRFLVAGKKKMEKNCHKTHTRKYFEPNE
jgi:hypothetical protein